MLSIVRQNNQQDDCGRQMDDDDDDDDDDDNNEQCIEVINRYALEVVQRNTLHVYMLLFTKQNNFCV